MLSLATSVVDSHQFDADLDHACNFDADADFDPACHFDADPGPDLIFFFDADHAWSRS
jgi:hypothetical protein